MPYDQGDIVERLVRRFGLGTRPDLRKSLFLRLGRLCEEVGDEAYYVISAVAADAAGKDHPDRYFVKVVMRRLIDRGVMKQGGL